MTLTFKPTRRPISRRLPAKVALAALLAASVAAPGFSQSSDPDDDVAEATLDLPDQFQTYGASDPNVRKATAIVNGEVITGTDVEQRLGLIMLGQQNRIPEAQLPRVRAQVLRDLIDETLEIQEARSQDIKIEATEINASYARVAQRFRQNPAKFGAFLTAHGTSERSMKRQITGEMAWNRLLGRQVEPYVNVSDDEVQSVITRLEASKGTSEYHVNEIFLKATPQNVQQIAANAQRMMEQIQHGASFSSYARQFSQATTAAVGGDLGWISAAQLPTALSQTVQELDVGQIAGPVEIPGGFSIVYLADKRQVLTNDPRDAVVGLRQISIDFAPGSNPAENKIKAEAFSKATRSMGGCGRATEVAKRFGGEIVDNDGIRIRDISPAVQSMLVNMSVGEATPVFGSPEQGVQVLVLCGRDDPVDETTPNADAIKGQIEQSRISQRAQRYLRELRRDAVIEYR